MPMSEVQSMTLWQLALFSTDIKQLKQGTKSVNSFAEAKAIIRERKQRGNKAG